MTEFQARFESLLRAQLPLVVSIAALLLLAATFYNAALNTNAIIKAVKPSSNIPAILPGSNKLFKYSYKVHDTMSIKPVSRLEDAHLSVDSLDRAASDVAAIICPPANEHILLGGLNNQLQDLAAFLSVACSTAGFGATVQLPGFSDDLVVQSALPFSAIFDSAHFTKASESMCHVDPSAINGNGASKCTRRVRQKGNAIGSWQEPMKYPFAYRALVYRSLRLAPPLQAIMDGCVRKRDDFWGGGSLPFIAVHIRVEDDWKQRCLELEEGIPGLHACLTPRHIAEIVQTKFARHPGIRRIQLIGALDRISSDLLEGPESVFEVWGPRTKVFSAHRGGGAGCFDSSDGVTKLAYTQRAAVESFIAVGADVFVGTAASSFTYGVAMMRSLQGSPGTLAAQSWSYLCAVWFAGREKYFHWEAAHAPKAVVVTKAKGRKGAVVVAPQAADVLEALPYQCI
jgi:hypothetical protein